MNSRVKAKWLAALRGGEYKQGHEQLRQGDSYCCLGVLCDLHAKENNHTWTGDVYLSADYVLPESVTAWSGLGEPNPKVGEFTLATYNDGCQKIRQHAFPEIADLIEKSL